MKVFFKREDGGAVDVVGGREDCRRGVLLAKVVGICDHDIVGLVQLLGVFVVVHCELARGAAGNEALQLDRNRLAGWTDDGRQFRLGELAVLGGDLFV